MTIPNPIANHNRAGPSEHPIASLALLVQVGAMPGRPGASPCSSSASETDTRAGSRFNPGEVDVGPTKERLYRAVSPEQISDFLAHAEGFHKANKKMEAAVPASAVLEDAMKMTAVKNGTLAHGSLEQIIE